MKEPLSLEKRKILSVRRIKNISICGLVDGLQFVLIEFARRAKLVSGWRGRYRVRDAQELGDDGGGMLGGRSRPRYRYGSHREV